MGRGAWPGFAFAVFALAGAARAQESQEAPEPLSVAYEAPEGCPTAEAFFREVSARTTRARAPLPDERARVMHVVVTRRGERYGGRLWIDDASRVGTARAVEGTTCSEVVGALALIGALAVDPRASTAPVAPTSRAQTDAGDALPPAPAPSKTAVSMAPPPTAQRAETPGPGPAPRPAPPPTRVGVAVGVQAEALFVAGAVGSGRVFGDLSFRSADSIFAPAIRLAVARSLDVDRAAAIGGASLRWTVGSLELCPLRLRLAPPLALRPCAGAAAGALDASGTGIAASSSRTRPWGALAALGRLVWEPLAWLDLELEAGATAPLVRESFFFTPSTAVYRAPPVAFLSRAGAGLRFP